MIDVPVHYVSVTQLIIAAVVVVFAVSAVMFLSTSLRRKLYAVFFQHAALKKELKEQAVLLRKALKDASEDKEKTQFVSLVAHQLRAPMTQMRWLVETMQETKRLPAHLRENLETLHAIVLKENQFVGDLLNVSRIERGILKLNTANVGVLVVLKETIEPLKSIAEERNIRLTIGDVPRTSRLSIDREKTVEALRNLVDNAIKYSPRGSVVNVDAVKNGSDFEIRITDHGSGIPEELWPELFEVKTVISSSVGENASSTGLGLYLTKQFIEAMGGTIRFETSSKGTTFFVRLPS